MSENAEDDFVPVTENLIRDKILHALSIWPRISPSMLQVGIGTSLSPKMWHPIFEQLIKEGRIQKEEVGGRGPTGRDQVYTVISLTKEDSEEARRARRLKDGERRPNQNNPDGYPED